MSHFAKRHYEEIATAMQCAHPGAGLSLDNRAVMQWTDTVAQLARAFAADNGMFKRDRFIRACQPGNNVRARS